MICIVAHRYGFEPEKGRGSITRREVEAAKAAGKDVLVWIVAEDYPWTEKKEQDLLNDPTVLADPERVADVVAVWPVSSRSRHGCGRPSCATRLRHPTISAGGSRSRCKTPPRTHVRDDLGAVQGEIRIVHALQPAPHFRGRDGLVEDLTDWVADPASPDRVWSLVAAGGTGKTADRRARRCARCGRARRTCWSGRSTSGPRPTRSFANVISCSWARRRGQRAGASNAFSAAFATVGLI